jgi:hypothetical protein
MIFGDLTPVIVALCVAIFFYVNSTLKKAAQPLRLRLAEDGEKLLAKPGLSPAMREYVEFLLDTSFSMRAILVFAIFALPIVAAVFIFRLRDFRESAEKFKTHDPETAKSFYDLCRLHDRITLINHFVLLPLVEIEIVVFMPLAVLIRGIFKGVVPEAGGRESTVMFVEDQGIHSLQKLKHAFASSR